MCVVVIFLCFDVLFGKFFQNPLVLKLLEGNDAQTYPYYQNQKHHWKTNKPETKFKAEMKIMSKGKSSKTIQKYQKDMRL